MMSLTKICMAASGLFQTTSTNISHHIRQLHLTSKFLSGTTNSRKRFYKKVGVVQSNGDFEVTLDNRKVKTPHGQVFRVQSEPLALAVANEWDAQNEKILLSSMHIASLCNTALDNPNKFSKYDLINHVLTYLDTDTLLCRQEENLELFEEQKQQWDPIIHWFCQHYSVEVEPTTSILGPVIKPETRQTLIKHLNSYDFWALIGITYSVEIAKSFITAMACIDRHLLVEEGIHIASLETDFQIRHWGRVEWAHDVETFEQQSRFAAAVLFTHLTTSSSGLERKVKQ